MCSLDQHRPAGGAEAFALPLLMGISYELIKLAGRYDNLFTRIISAPGLWLQRLTTFEPDDSMIEVAIAAVTPCCPKLPKEPHGDEREAFSRRARPAFCRRACLTPRFDAGVLMELPRAGISAGVRNLSPGASRPA